MNGCAFVDTCTRVLGGLRTRGQIKRSQSQAPLITVITPVYNAAGSLERTIRSVISQQYRNLDLEYLIVDAGSTDGSLDIIRRYEDRLDYWLSEPDRGVYDAMNKGARLATGDWLYFLGADDVLVNCLRAIAARLRDHRCVYYGDVYLPSRNKVYGGEFKFHTLISKNISHQAIFYPRSVFSTYSYDLRYRIMADYDLNIKAGWIEDSGLSPFLSWSASTMTAASATPRSTPSSRGTSRSW